MSLWGHDRGSTLIELLIVMTITAIILPVIAAALILGLKSNKEVSEQLLDSHDAQLVSAYLPSDLLSVLPNQIDANAGTPSGCAGSPPEPWNVVRLTWSEATAGGGTDWFRVTYRVVQIGTDWRLNRLACTSSSEAGLSSAPAKSKLLIRNLRPAAQGLPTVIQDGERLKIRFTDASGYSFTVSGSRRTVAVPGSPAPPRPRPVEVSDVGMFDDDPASPTARMNGRVDRTTVTFSGPLPDACRNASYFSLGSVPSAGTLSSVSFGAAGSTTANLTITEGAGTPDTAIGDFRVLFTPATGCDALAYDGPPTRDLARPVVVGFTAGLAGPVNPLAGKAEQADSFVITFSEPVLGFPASGGTMKLAGTSPNTLTLQQISSGAISLGSSDYFDTGGNKSADIPLTIAADATGRAYTLTLGVCVLSAQDRCDLILQSPNGGPMTFLPAATLKDSAGNIAAPRGSSPVPTGTFKAF